LRTEHEQVANYDFLVGFFLVDLRLHRFQLRQLGVDVRIQDEFHDTLPFGYGTHLENIEALICDGR
jgi:hypothetical protein